MNKIKIVHIQGFSSIEKAIKLNSDSQKTKNALKIFNSVKNNELIDLNDFRDITSNSFLKRNEMIEDVIIQIKTIFNHFFFEFIKHP